MRATVVQRESVAASVAPDAQRNAQEHRLLQPPASHFGAAQRGVPEAKKHPLAGALDVRRWRLGCGWRKIAHEKQTSRSINVIWAKPFDPANLQEHVERR